MIRLNKHISNAGVCTRKEADKLILSGKIKVNGVVVTTLGTKVNHQDQVEYNGKILTSKKYFYYLINKVKGQKAEVLLNDKIEGENLKSIYHTHISNAGLMFFTNDFELINRIAADKNPFKQKCIIELDKSVDEELLDELAKGLNFNEETYKVHNVQLGNKDSNNNTLIITMSFFADNSINDYFDLLGYKVKYINRIVFDLYNR